MNITVNGQDLSIVIKRSRRARHMRLSVYRGGEVSLTVPYIMNEKHIALYVPKFISDKGGWLTKTVNKLKKLAPLPPKRSVKEIREEYLRLKEDARRLVTERLKYFNLYYKLPYKKIAIRNQKSRWGSCSKKGNLNFNYKMALLPQELVDYVVVHELCHVAQMNHSKKFWDLVAETTPKHQELRKKLHEFSVKS